MSNGPSFACLIQRRNNVLAQMSILADADGVGVLEFKGKGSKKTTKEPTNPQSLWEHWRVEFAARWPVFPRVLGAEFDAAYSTAERLCLAAERDYRLRVGKFVDDGATPKEKDRRLIREYEGKPALDVAVLEGCSVAHIKAVRRQHDRDPLTGKHARLRR